jgi:hypothetical protein
MKKVRISLAALTLIVAIAGTTTANATKTSDAFPCYQVDPDGSICTNSTATECCEDDDHNIRTEKGLDD